jgi:hypothetical protein
MPLAEGHTGSPGLFRCYQRNLLEPGWAGELNPDELAYIKSELKKSPSLKRRWGFRPTAKRFSEKKIRAVATYGVAKKGRF